MLYTGRFVLVGVTPIFFLMSSRFAQFFCLTSCREPEDKIKGNRGPRIHETAGLVRDTGFSEFLRLQRQLQKLPE